MYKASRILQFVLCGSPIDYKGEQRGERRRFPTKIYGGSDTGGDDKWASRQLYLFIRFLPVRPGYKLTLKCSLVVRVKRLISPSTAPTVVTLGTVLIQPVITGTQTISRDSILQCLDCLMAYILFPIRYKQRWCKL